MAVNGKLGMIKIWPGISLDVFKIDCDFLNLNARYDKKT
jgi:hypothetical protein